MTFPHRRPRRLAAAFFSLVAFAALHASDAVPAGWFVWPATEPQDGSAPDVSWLNPARGDRLPRLAVRGEHFVTLPEGRALRLWGCNLGAEQALPPSADEARQLARRLAKGGVNIARLHHLDNAWSGSLWPKGRGLHRELDPAQLDRLHRLIAALRDQGIYSNLNLKVSKTLVPADGFAETVTQFPHFQKRVDIYDRRMIELQKDYARRLLTTKNPYTGLAPAEDPAVGVVELTNENSLLGYWTRNLGQGLDQFPEPFRGELQGQWNDWLVRRYADDRDLARAWQPPPASADSLIAPDASWQKRIRAGVAASITPGADGALTIAVAAGAGVAHHVQAALHALPLVDGETYTVRFEARTDTPRPLGLGISADRVQPWRSLGLQETVRLGAEWRTVELSFVAHSVGTDRAVLSVNAGQAAGTVWIQGFRLLRGAPGAGLQPGQSARQRTVPIPTHASPRQWADWIAFLAETERAFADEMRTFLKDELHVQAPIVCSQIDYGGLTALHREQAMEFADAHAYWQHPQFTGRDWDLAHWVIANTPQLAEFRERSFGDLGGLALVRVAGKPFTVSEFDHPAPSEFACEMYPTLASFAARQGWDGIYPFCIGAYGSANADGRIHDFFDQLNHPAKWGQSPFAALLFRRGLVPRAPVAAGLQLGAPVWAKQPHADTLWQQQIAGSFDFLNVRYAVSDRPGATGAAAQLTRTGRPDAAAPLRLVTAPRGQVYLIDCAEAAGIVGFIGGAELAAGALRVACPRFGLDFASVTAVALDGRPLTTSARVLVTVAARAGNQGMIWNPAHDSVGKHFGRGPTIAERVPATITFAGDTGRHVHALAPDGSRARRIDTTAVAGGVRFQIGPEDASLHYEIVAE